MKTYGSTCPVCGYDNIPVPVEDHAICPCCLFTFYVNDVDWTIEELRAEWIAYGAKWAWGSDEIPSPLGWSSIEQLKNIGYECTFEDLRNIARGFPQVPYSLVFKDESPYSLVSSLPKDELHVRSAISPSRGVAMPYDSTIYYGNLVVT